MKRLLLALSLGSFALLPGLAAAQATTEGAAAPDAAPAVELTPEAAAAQAIEPAPAAPPAAPPAPPAPAAPPASPAIPIRATGILHAAVIASTGVQSFSWPTAVAITGAANPVLLADPNAALLSFQVQQTRAGLIIGEGTPVKGQLEVDFVHFDTSSPTVQAFPRLRIALIDWTPAEGHHLFLGQTWDIFSPVNSHTFNLVGNLFNAGNSGFMRHQLGWNGRFGDLEVVVAAGMQGANAGPTFNNIERSATPTGSARLGYYLAPKSWFGVSAIASSLRFTSGTMRERRASFGASAFADLTFGPISLRAEAYVAQNMVNMGALTLGTGRFGQDVMDAGGFVSGKATFGVHAITAMFGMAAALAPSKVVPGYTPAVDNMGVITPAATSAAAGPGIEQNVTAHIGYSFTPLAGLQLVVEPFIYSTRYRLAASDVAAGVKADRFAGGVELGMMYSF